MHLSLALPVESAQIFWSVVSCIWTEYKPEKNSAFGHFSRSAEEFHQLLGKNIDRRHLFRTVSHNPSYIKRLT